MSEELKVKDILKKIEELREDINKMVVDNSLGDEEVIKKSRIMDMHLNRYQELINSKKEKIDSESIDPEDIISKSELFSDNEKESLYKKKLERELLQELESDEKKILEMKEKKNQKYKGLFNVLDMDNEKLKK